MKLKDCKLCIDHGSCILPKAVLCLRKGTYIIHERNWKQIKVNRKFA